MYSISDATRKAKKVISEDMEAVSLKHHHPIDEVDGLSASLAQLSTTKSDVNHTHETLNDVKILKLSLSTTSATSEASTCEGGDDRSFTFFVDDSGNLCILNDDLVIGKYITSERDWLFGDISLKEVDSTLENHYKALTKIKQVLKEAGLILVNSQ